MWAVPTKAEGVLGGTMAADTGMRLNAAGMLEGWKRVSVVTE